MGHRDLLVTQTYLSPQATTARFASCVASAAGRLRSNALTVVSPAKPSWREKYLVISTNWELLRIFRISRNALHFSASFRCNSLGHISRLFVTVLDSRHQVECCGSVYAELASIKECPQRLRKAPLSPIYCKNSISGQPF